MLKTNAFGHCRMSESVLYYDIYDKRRHLATFIWPCLLGVFRCVLYRIGMRSHVCRNLFWAYVF